MSNDLETNPERIYCLRLWIVETLARFSKQLAKTYGCGRVVARRVAACRGNM